MKVIFLCDWLWHKKDEIVDLDYGEALRLVNFEIVRIVDAGPNFKLDKTKEPRSSWIFARGNRWFAE